MCDQRRHDGLLLGANFSGQLGDGKFSSSNVPIAVTGLANIDQLSAHGNFTCAHATDGSVSCWGAGGDGEIGNDNYQTSPTPQKVIPSSAKKVATGFIHACAIKADDALACWGGSYTGQLGDGGYNSHGTPIVIPGISGVREITGGDSHTCALLSDGTVSCWGDDRAGQLADGLSAAHGQVAPLLPCP